LVLAGIVLGKSAALCAGKQAAQTQSYGTEARGGASQCNVVIDDKEITYVGVVNPDIFVVMSQEAYDKLIGDVKDGCRVFYDSDLVRIKGDPKLRQTPVPSTRTARALGKQMVANIVMLGAMVEGTKILDPDRVAECLKESVPSGTEELNLKAFGLGRSLV
jgi:2-oxoglutarate ferredoxin oxidoreductase subunit gamma